MSFSTYNEHSNLPPDIYESLGEKSLLRQGFNPIAILFTYGQPKHVQVRDVETYDLVCVDIQTKATLPLRKINVMFAIKADTLESVKKGMYMDQNIRGRNLQTVSRFKIFFSLTVSVYQRFRRSIQASQTAFSIFLVFAAGNINCYVFSCFIFVFFCSIREIFMKVLAIAIVVYVAMILTLLTFFTGCEEGEMLKPMVGDILAEPTVDPILLVDSEKMLTEEPLPEFVSVLKRF